MTRLLFGLIATIAIAGAACGSDDRKTQSSAGAQPSATDVAPTAAPSSASAASTPKVRAIRTSAAGDSKEAGSVFGSLFGSALSGAGGGGSTARLGAGDPALKAYLPSASDLPPGYSSFGEFSFRTPDGVSKTGGIDIAATMAFSGDVTSNGPIEGRHPHGDGDEAR